MAYTTKATFKSGMAFDIELQGETIKVDAAPEVGGHDDGARPKPLMLSALAGCTGMDVVSILGKMRMQFDSFAIEVDGTSADDHPKVYKAVHIRYLFTGGELDRGKIEKAVNLSLDKYCGVANTLKHTADITYEIVLS